MGRPSSDKTCLRKAITMRGFTAEMLARETGIPVGTINAVAGGFSRMSPARVEKCAKALNVTPEELRGVCCSTDFLAKPKPTKRTERHAPANKDGIVVQPPMTTEEKLVLIVNQLARRVRVLEAQVKELADD